MSVLQRTVFVGQDSRLGSGDGGNSFGLWTSDGVAATEAVALTGPPDQAGLSSISTAAPLPGSLVFAVGRAPGGPLFATDPGTGLPVELAAPALPASDTPEDMTSIGNVVLFNAQDATGAYDLWRTDGTAAGTTALAISAAPYGLAPTSITAFGGGALFTGNGADGYNDIFFTDGTAAGTHEIAAFATPVPPTNPFGLLPAPPPPEYFVPLGTLGDQEVFGGAGGALWSTDGTAAGTVPIAATALAPAGSPSTVLGGRLFYAAFNYTGTTTVYPDGLYVTDGTAAGSGEVSALRTETSPDLRTQAVSEAYGLTTLGDRIVFGVETIVDTAATVGELWVSDGTAAGTRPLGVAVAPGTVEASLQPQDLTLLGSRVLFAGRDTAATGGTVATGLWITDGTEAGTQEIAPDLDPAGITALGNGTAEFSGTGGLYVTDGTAAGTRLVASTGAAQAGLAPTTIQAAPSPLTFSGTQAQYALAPAASGALQTRDLSSSANLDLPDARVLAFGDGSTAVFDPTGNAEAIARLHLAAYGRAPDLAGLLACTQQAGAGTVSLARIAAAAPGSPQFLAAYGTLTDARFVAHLYENADGRAPDAGGLAGYTAALASGQTRGQVLLAIAESPEARVHSQAVAGNADDATVTRLYEAIDGRAPDVGGLIGYATALDAGQSVQAIAAAMLASPEYAAKLGTPTDSAFVTALYQTLLGRAPDPGGLASYTAALAGGETRAQLVAGFVASDEARLVTAPLTHLGYVSLG